MNMLVAEQTEKSKQRSSCFSIESHGLSVFSALLLRRPLRLPNTMTAHSTQARSASADWWELGEAQRISDDHVARNATRLDLLANRIRANHPLEIRSIGVDLTPGTRGITKFRFRQRLGGDL
jgi:hypothetical protein